MGIDRKKVRSAAQKQVRKGNWNRAIDKYEKLVDDDPDDVRSRLKLADLYTRIGNEERAVESYCEVGDRHARDDIYQKAVAVYKQAIRLDPDDPELHRKVGEAYHRLDRLKDAAQAFRRAQDRFKEAGDREKQLEVLEELVRLDPEDVGLRIQLAETYAKRDREEDAVERFREAAEMLEEEGRHDDYAQVAERIVYFDPNDMDVRRKATRIYTNRNDHKRALKHLQVLFNNNPNDEETLRRLADTFRELDRTEKAVMVYRKLAEVYEERGRRDSARQTWNRILDVDPTNNQAQEALQRLGDSTAAEPERVSGSRESAEMPAISPDDEDSASDALDEVEFLDEGPDTPEPQRGVDPDESPAEPDRGASSPDEFGGEPTETKREPIGDAERDELQETSPAGHEPAGPGDGEFDGRSDDLDPVEASGGPSTDELGAASSVETDDLDELLDETEVFLKYSLYDNARELIDKLLELAPDHLDVHRKQRKLHREVGDSEAEASTLVEMARLCDDRPRQAENFLAEAAELGAPTEKLEAARAELGLGGDDRQEPVAAGAGEEPAGSLDEATAAIDDAPTDRPEAESTGGEFALEDDMEFVEATAAEGESDEFSEFAGFGDDDFVEETEVLDEDDFVSDDELEAVDSVDEDFEAVPETSPSRQSAADPSNPPGEVDHRETEFEDSNDLAFSDRDVEGAIEDLFQGVGGNQSGETDERLAEIDTLIEAGRHEEAEAALRSLEQQHPDHPGLELRYQRLEASDSGEREFRRRPTGSRSLSGEFEPLAPEETEATDEDDDHVEVDVMHSSLELGLSYREMEMYDEAISEFQEAIADPEAAPAAKYHLAVCKAEKGEIDEAADDLSRLLRYDQLPGELRDAARDKLESLEA